MYPLWRWNQPVEQSVPCSGFSRWWLRGSRRTYHCSLHLTWSTVLMHRRWQCDWAFRCVQEGNQESFWTLAPWLNHTQHAVCHYNAYPILSPLISALPLSIEYVVFPVQCASVSWQSVRADNISASVMTLRFTERPSTLSGHSTFQFL